MNWTENTIRNIVTDLADENPLACQALLEIAEIEFTGDVPTMAVTLSERPVLKINLGFCREHLQSECDVKCVLLHEFLHVMLDHTSEYKESNPLLNIALDAIINAIIWRTKGEEYGQFFMRFYEWDIPTMVLRNQGSDVSKGSTDWTWYDIHERLYRQGCTAADLYEFLNSKKMMLDINALSGITFLGNHNRRKKPGPAITKVLDGIMAKMDGTGIWNNPGGIGHSFNSQEHDRMVSEFRLNRWKQATAEIMKKIILPSLEKGLETESSQLLLPVLSTSDRRSFLRFRTGGLIPFATHESTSMLMKETVNVYLDVSGSMEQELNPLVALLYNFRDTINWPLMGFSDELWPAEFRNGKIKIKTTSGTDIQTVFNHIREKKIPRALVITDGYVGKIPPASVMDINKKNVWFLISQDGSPSDIDAAGFPYRILPKSDWKS